MGSFDEIASKSYDDINLALKTTTDRKREIEESGIASVNGVEQSWRVTCSSSSLVTAILPSLAFSFFSWYCIAHRRSSTSSLTSAALRAEELNQLQDEEREINRRNTALVISSLGEGLDKLSNGDLSVSIPDPFPSGLDVLRENFNASVAALRNALVAVVNSSEQIKAGTSEIADASRDLARRTEKSSR